MMRFAPLFVIVSVIAYFIGSIPFGLLLGGVNGIDIRQHGSGNIGATNIWRVLGKKWGLPTFLLDLGKGFIAVLVAKWLALNWGVTVPLPHGHSRIDFIDPSLPGIAAAMAVILGHNFPVWLKFKGGKGVATSLGVLFGLMPVASTLTFLTWVVVVKITRYVSLASIIAALSLPLWVLGLFMVPLNLGGMRGWPYFYFTVVATLVLILRHTANIKRLIAGTESQIGSKKAPVGTNDPPPDIHQEPSS